MSEGENFSAFALSRRRAFGFAALALSAPATFMSLISGRSFGQASRYDSSSRMFQLAAEFNAKVGDFWTAVGGLQHLAGNEFDDNNPYSTGKRYIIGGKRSFVPDLGKTLWELPEALAARVPFSARIYQVSNGRPIGYVRVPHYNYDEDAAKEFANLIAHFENATEVLVLDQVDNLGGSMFQMYAMLECLTDRVLILPKHQLALNEDDAAIASDNVALADAGEAVPPELVAYSRFVLSEYSEIQAGRREPATPGTPRLTNPGYLMGVKEILPNKNHYTKKIVVLINELTFSAAEFLAAILQDNKRATLFGARTAGAGGCVRKFTHFPKANTGRVPFSFTLTWTVAWRPNGQPIQKIGVHPDVSYSTTVEDVRSGYAGYRQALLTTIGT